MNVITPHLINLIDTNLDNNCDYKVNCIDMREFKKFQSFGDRVLKIVSKSPFY